MELLPGDRVVIIMNAYSHEMSEWHNADTVDATEGSTGRVLSYTEYRELFHNSPDVIIRDHYVRDDPEYVEVERGKGTLCALMFETVKPFTGKARAIRCAVGRVVVLDDRFIRKLSKD